MAAPFSECMNCSSIWSPGTEEYDFQHCDACGWEPGQAIDDDGSFDDDADEYFDNPNDYDVTDIYSN